MSHDINNLIRQMNSQSAIDWQKAAEQARTQFIEDCQHASIVRIAGGTAILIGGNILQINCPEHVMIDWLVMALRGARNGVSSTNMTAAEVQSARKEDAQ